MQLASRCLGNGGNDDQGVVFHASEALFIYSIARLALNP